jgi:hypothetical protein
VPGEAADGDAADGADIPCVAGAAVTSACAPSAAGSTDSRFTCAIALSASGVFFISFATMYTPNHGAACNGADTEASRYFFNARAKFFDRYAVLASLSDATALSVSVGLPELVSPGVLAADAGAPNGRRPSLSDGPHATIPVLATSSSASVCRWEDALRALMCMLLEMSVKTVREPVITGTDP